MTVERGSTFKFTDKLNWILMVKVEMSNDF